MWVPKYFAKSLDAMAQEVLPKEFYEKHGVVGLNQMDERVLRFLDVLSCNLTKQEGRKVGITVNSWKWGGVRNQSGLRIADFYPTVGEYVYSRSQHKLGRAVDFKVKGMPAHEVRKHIIENKHLYPDISFIEVSPIDKKGKAMTWIHVDVRLRLDNDQIKYWSPVLGYVSESKVLKEKL